MTRSPVIPSLIAATLAVLALAFVWPTVAVVTACVEGGGASSEASAVSARQLMLLGRSALLAALAAGLCLIIALPGVVAVGRAWRSAPSPLLPTVLAISLLCPPMVYVFGWDRLLPSSVGPTTRCVMVWAFWAWPIPALLVGAAWSRVAASAHDAARMSASPINVLLHVDLPAVVTPALFSALILFVLFLGDYSVPHAGGLIVYATELLGWASSSSRPIDVLWPAAPGIALIAAAMLVAWRGWRRRDALGVPVGIDAVRAEPDRSGLSGTSTGVVLVVLALTWGVPLVSLGRKLGSASAISEAIRTYAGVVADTLLIAAGGGLVAVLVGVGVAAWRPIRSAATAWTLLFGAIPGALVGEALVAAYSHGPLSVLYSAWPILMLGYVARFAWLGVIGAMLIRRQASRELIDQAMTDGADRDAVLTHVTLALHWPVLVATAAVITVLAVGEAPTTSMLAVPGIGSLSLIIIEKFHRFEDGMLAALSLTTVAAAGGVAVVLGAIVRRSTRRAGS